MQYLVTFFLNTLNPIYSSVFERKNETTYEARLNFIWPLRLHVKPHLKALNTDLDILVDKLKFSIHIPDQSSSMSTLPCIGVH